MSRIVGIIVAVLAGILAGAMPHAAATGAPRSIADCEKIKDDDAFNRCLASFGPKRGASRARGTATPAAVPVYDPADAPKARSPRSSASARAKINRVLRRARAARANRIRVQRLRNGRIRSVIPMGRGRR